MCLVEEMNNIYITKINIAIKMVYVLVILIPFPKAWLEEKHVLGIIGFANKSSPTSLWLSQFSGVS